MAKNYFPNSKLTKLISASPPHPKKAQYKVSIGLEDWGENEEQNIDVVKIQMAYDGAVSGRKNPSYPLGTDDFFRVAEAVKELIAERDKLHQIESKAIRTPKKK